MEQEMIDRHADELAKLSVNDQTSNSVTELSEEKSQEEAGESAVRISKAQKRREKKEQEAKLREIEILQAEEDNKNSARNLEVRTIDELLKSRKLKSISIKSDGDCLYNALSHQLNMVGTSESVESLRKIAASYIRANRDDLICFMTSKSNDIMTPEEFDEYCNQVEKTKAWGSQIEIQAISNSLRVKIEVLQASGAPTISGSDFGKKRPHLIVTYHRHLFGLGEHYNSTSVIESS